ncbi:hypothetical protein [Methylibium petroleiphilum]
MSHTNPLPEQALLAARRFIKNGVALGYIRMPDADCPDPAHDTLPLIERALEAYDLGARSTAAQPLTLTDAEIDRVFDAHEEAPQLAYRYLVAHALLAAAQPAGWKLVPIEPTADMRNAFHAVTDDDVTMKGAAGSRWAAMLAAAPPAASGDSTPASLEVHMDREHGGLAFGKGDPSGALRPEPEAVGQGRWWRKKPVVIEAFQWNGLESGCQAAKARFPELETSSKSGHLRRPEVTSWHIRTLEGHMRVSPGDWIVRGVAGEFYPCKPDIFAATYEPAEPPQAASVERGGD